MRILITGVAGFIGSTLADRLVYMGHTVFGVDNFETGREENLNPDVRFTEMDVARGIDGRFDLIIHCAASYKDPNQWRYDVGTNVEGAIALARLAKNTGARLIYFQTVLPPISSYAISKIAGEHYLRLSGQPLAVFRLAAVYGPRNLSGAIPTFYRQVSQGKPCTVVEDATRDFVFVDDLVDLVMARLDFEDSDVIDVRTGVEMPIRYIPQLIGKMLDTKPIVNLVARRDDDVAHYEMNGTPRIGTPFAEGVKRAVEWYERNGVSDTYTHLKLGATNAS